MAYNDGKTGAFGQDDIRLQRIGPLTRHPEASPDPELHHMPTSTEAVRYVRSAAPHAPMTRMEGADIHPVPSLAPTASKVDIVRYTRSPDILELKRARAAMAQHVRPAAVEMPAGASHQPTLQDALDVLAGHIPQALLHEVMHALAQTQDAAPPAPPVEAPQTSGSAPLNDNAPLVPAAPPPAIEPAESVLHAPNMARLAAELTRRPQPQGGPPAIKPASLPQPAPTVRAAAPASQPVTAYVPVYANEPDAEEVAETAAHVYDTRRRIAAPEAANQISPLPSPAPAMTLASPAHAASAPQALASRLSAVTPLAPAAPPRAASLPYELPPVSLLAEPPVSNEPSFNPETLEQNARLLEGILEDFGIRGEIIDVRPGPVVTLYELEPAAGIKSSRVIGLAEDIARSMSAVSARVAVIPGRNVIGIELPNVRREMVYFRELIESEDFQDSSFKLALSLGKTIGGESVIAQLEKMPHLLVAGTTGSGKSVAINTMILSLLYRLKPDECRLIMVDPKMLELSIYDGIPHLLSPVVTDPKKAVLALKWAVREMEERYKKMSKMGVRNIDGYNTRAAAAREAGEVFTVEVQTGFDKATGRPTYEMQEMDISAMPYIVIIVDEMADLMMVAGKEIEGAIQRLAQMARAAGIHLIMATQRPSVDVITGTIKANFPTRISFQVTSKIDSRTILGEQGAEQLLGQGDMLHMVGGGRISRVHGPFVSDQEVEKVVRHLKAQGQPAYLEAITAEDEPAGEEDGGDNAVFDSTAMGAEDGVEKDLYDQAVKVVLRDKKCSTSYIQRRLQIGYNKAATLVERMEKEGMVGAANHAGKREILVYSRDFAKGYTASREDGDED